jgi:succinoglycan biosynthesis protein ExoM
MSDRKEHITVCLCTYRRPAMLRKLLERVFAQETEGLFTLSVSVVDNDPARSGRAVVDDFLKRADGAISYSPVPERNLALLRNASVQHSRGDYVAFIDDDEYPDDRWLLLLYRTLHACRADGALGPVVPEFLDPPPAWIVRGKIGERVRLKTGARLDWHQTRMGNALLKRSLLLVPGDPFDPKFRLGAEDDSFFRKLMSQGHVFVWCDEAVVHEQLPAARLTLDYFSRRSRLIGYMTCDYGREERSRPGQLLLFLKSCLMAGISLPALPLFRIRGYHHYAKLVIRYHFHKAVVLTCLGALKIEERDL